MAEVLTARIAGDEQAVRLRHDESHLPQFAV